MATTTTTTSNPIWDKYGEGAAQAATAQYNQGIPAYYPHATVAGFDPLRSQGANLGVDAALGAQTQLAQGQTGLLSGILQGTDAGTQRLASQAATAAGSPFGQAGTFGGARHARAANQAAADAILGRQLQASGQVAGAQSAAAQPGRTLASIGREFQDYQQDVIDADRARYDYTAGAPDANVDRYIQRLGLLSGQAPTTQSTAKKASLLENIGGILSIGKGFGFFAEGGEVDATGAEVSPIEALFTGIAPPRERQDYQASPRDRSSILQRLAPVAFGDSSGYQAPRPPSSPFQSAGPQGVYNPVEVEQPSRGGWQQARPSHGWAIIDGRYQMVPTQGSAPGMKTGDFERIGGPGTGNEGEIVVDPTTGKTATRETATQNVGNLINTRAREEGWDPNNTALSAEDWIRYREQLGRDPTVVSGNAIADATNPDYESLGSPEGQAADTIYSQNLNVSGEGADDGGIIAAIRGQGDDVGSSLATGTQSNVGLQDHLIAAGETIGGISPVIGKVADVAAENIAPRDPNQQDRRTAQEVSIARHAKNWQDQAPETPIELSEYKGPTIVPPTDEERIAAAAVNPAPIPVRDDGDDNTPTHEEILETHRAIRERNKELGYSRTPEESAAAAGFDMNRPETWVDPKDSNRRQSDSNNDDNGGGGSSGGGK